MAWAKTRRVTHPSPDKLTDPNRMHPCETPGCPETAEWPNALCLPCAMGQEPVLAMQCALCGEELDVLDELENEGCDEPVCSDCLADLVEQDMEEVEDFWQWAERQG